MYRQSLLKATRLTRTRAFTTTSRAMAGGDTGATRSTGQAGGDAFTKREQANENYAVRQREKEKFMELKKKILLQKDHLQKLEEHLDEMNQQQGHGEGQGSGLGEQK